MDRGTLPDLYAHRAGARAGTGLVRLSDMTGTQKRLRRRHLNKTLCGTKTQTSTEVQTCSRWEKTKTPATGQQNPLGQNTALVSAIHKLETYDTNKCDSLSCTNTENKMGTEGPSKIKDGSCSRPPKTNNIIVKPNSLNMTSNLHTSRMCKQQTGSRSRDQQIEAKCTELLGPTRTKSIVLSENQETGYKTYPYFKTLTTPEDLKAWTKNAEGGRMLTRTADILLMAERSSMSHMDMDQHVVELQYAYAGQIRKDKITIIKHRLHLAGDTHIELGYKDTGAFFVYDCEGESFSLIAIGQEQPQNANYNARCTAIHAAGAAHKAAFGANGAVKNITILKKASLEQPSIHGKRLNEVQIRQTQPTPKKLSLGKKKKPQKRRAKPRHSMRELEMRNVHTASSRIARHCRPSRQRATIAAGRRRPCRNSAKIKDIKPTCTKPTIKISAAVSRDSCWLCFQKTHMRSKSKSNETAGRRKKRTSIRHKHDPLGIGGVNKWPSFLKARNIGRDDDTPRRLERQQTLCHWCPPRGATSWRPRRTRMIHPGRAGGRTGVG